LKFPREPVLADTGTIHQSSAEITSGNRRKDTSMLNTPCTGATISGDRKTSWPGSRELAIARALAHALYADLPWCETSTPDLELAGELAEAIKAGEASGLQLSPSFLWKNNLDDCTIGTFQRSWPQWATNSSSLPLQAFPHGYKERQMAAHAELQTWEFAAEPVYQATC
jgi:isocitrate lyase